MKKIMYAVIILNYNTAQDAIKATKSVIDSALDGDDYIVCVVDGGSTKENERDILQTYQHDKYVPLILDKNLGYARGNNAGIDYVKKYYDANYYVIMNPDVLIHDKGVIAHLIDQIKDDESLAGAQPLINNTRTQIDPLYQVNIRRVPSYTDCLVESSMLLKRIFRNKYERTVYKKEMPYKNKIRFEVPSGAFFLIRSKDFEQVGGFSPNTFLYQEENILGYKLKHLNKKFLLDPSVRVDHLQGGSTGSYRKHITEFSYQCNVDSMMVYMDECLKISAVSKRILKAVMTVNYYAKCALFKKK